MRRLGKLSSSRRARGAAALVLVLTLGGHAAAGPIQSGVGAFDVIAGPGTSFDFSKSPVAAGALFPGSAAFSGTVSLEGAPFAPAVFGTNAFLIDFPQVPDPPAGTSKTVPAELVGFVLKSVSPVAIASTTGGPSTLYNVSLGLDPMVDKNGKGKVTFTGQASGNSSLHGGMFDAALLIDFQPASGGSGVSVRSHDVLTQSGAVVWALNKGPQGALQFTSTAGGLSVAIGHAVNVHGTPEPASLSLAGFGALTLLVCRRCGRRARRS